MFYLSCICCDTIWNFWGFFKHDIICFPQSAAVLASERNAAQEARNSIENQVKELTEENEKLKRTVDELEIKTEELHKQINSMKGEENLMKEKIKRYEVS